MGKPVDMGALFLQNENIRAVGNMNSNARGDILDSSNRVVETKSRQAQRKYRRQTNVTSGPVVSDTVSAKKQSEASEAVVTDTFDDLLQEDNFEEPPVVPSVPSANTELAPRGGLAVAIARSREVKQELEKTARQRAQEQGLKKI
jgi:hypothetical protein